MKQLLLLAICVFATPLVAADGPLPALYDVQGVASRDVLNVRERPIAQAAIVGTLAFNAQAVEVIRLGPRGGWALINIGESAGWVSLRYLERQTAQWVKGLPPITQCFGTEPFWSFEVAEGLGDWQEPGLSQTFRIGPGARAIGRSDSFGFVGMRQGQTVSEETAAIVVHQRACSDGMSDREYGLSVSVLFNQGQEDNQIKLYSGCCTVAR